ncbi:MAG: tagaturonate reductase [Defluviitaleaceae bacterium]|nr:tagaturonate reductase [Defluviitaleaceae bacterium]
MEQLNRSMIIQGKENFLNGKEIGFQNTKMEERVLQFGEGNFLRAFIDSFIDMLNEKGLFNGSIVVVQPIEKGLIDALNAQDGCYTVLLRGLENQVPTIKKRIVKSISRGINPYTDFDSYLENAKNPNLRYIISNTTEAGITFLNTDKLDDKPPTGFPGKVTVLLYERYKHFNADSSKGFIFIPCELIDNNGAKLKETVLLYAEKWGLPKEFIEWIHTANHFTSTLVDRIVTGYPRDEAETLSKELGYKDNLIVTAEIFQFLAIEAEKEVSAEISENLPFHKANLDVVLTEDVTPYKQRKVRILNGAHTMSVLLAYLYGKETVKEMMDDEYFVDYLKKGIYEEIIPTLDLNKEDLESFADSVFDRFANPYIKHYLLDISLNSVSKYKTRVLPSILEYHKRTGNLPEKLTMSFAALIAFYKGGSHKVADDEEIVTFFKEQWEKYGMSQMDQLVQNICARKDYWGQDLNELPGFSQKIAEYLKKILERRAEA